jgi:DNA polymerase-3 subunit delta'
VSAPPSRPLGQDRVLARLERAAELTDAETRGRGMPHAALFSGPAGVGKWLAARWWCRTLKCAHSGACDPTCSDCKRIGAGSHPDLVAIEPEAPGKAIAIDQVRELIRLMSLKCVGRGPRIALLRDAHELSIEAQSALLKLLEEPPGNALIVLVTENPSALLSTVRSRCQTFRFGGIPDADVEELLVAAGRDAETARRAAALARGRIGRALGLDAETIADRDELVAGLEALEDRDPLRLEEQVAALVERTKQGKPGLDEWFEWTLVRIEAALGYETAAESATLTRKLRDSSPADLGLLLARADGIHRTSDALERNANAKLAIRDMLLGGDEA